MSKERYSDQEIIDGLNGDQTKRDSILKSLYLNKTLRNYITGFVKRYGGNEQDGQDTFQDALILLDRRIREGGYSGTGTIEGYLQGIAKRVWFRKRDKWDNRTEELNNQNQKEELVDSPEVIMISEEKNSLIQAILEQLGEKCKTILSMYGLNHSMEEIAKQLGFANPKVAKNEAYRCRMKFRKFALQHPNLLELLQWSPSK